MLNRKVVSFIFPLQIELKNNEIESTGEGFYQYYDN